MRRLMMMPLVLMAAAVMATPAAAEPVRVSGGSAVSADTFYWVFSPGSRAWSPICPCSSASMTSKATVSGGGARIAAGGGFQSVAGSGDLSLDVKSRKADRKEKQKLHYTSWGTTAVWNNGNGNVLFSHGMAGLGSPRFDEEARLLVPGFAKRLAPQGSGSPVPEPTTLLLLGAGLTGAGLRKKWRR